jgi:hypothetical protein
MTDPYKDVDPERYKFSQESLNEMFDNFSKIGENAGVLSDHIAKALSSISHIKLPSTKYTDGKKKKKRGAGFTKRRICARTGKSSSRR